jgi:hypothetical protein
MRSGFGKKTSFTLMSCRGTLLCILILISFLWVGTSACGSLSESKAPNNPASDSDEEIHFVGEVKWIPLEGGFYGIVAEDGRKFLPLNLPERFCKDGLKLRVRGMIRKDIVTFRMWGKPFEIHQIEAE